MVSKKTIRDVLLLVVFILLISWTIDFKFMTLEDVRLIIVMLLATSILILIGSEDIMYKLEVRFRLNLFVTGLILSLFIMLGGLTEGSKQLDEIVFAGVKPLLFSLIIYIPLINVIRRVVEKEANKEKTKINKMNTLTNREKEVYNEILKDITNQEISSNLFIAETTVKKHIQNILKKLECENKEEIIKSQEK